MMNCQVKAHATRSSGPALSGYRRGLFAFWLAATLILPAELVLIVGEAHASTQSKQEDKGKGEDEEPKDDKLGDFADEATDDGEGDEKNEEAPPILFELVSGLGKMAGLLFVYGGIASWHRTHNDHHDQPIGPEQQPANDLQSLTPRNLGDSLIPFVALDAGFQDVESDVRAVSFHLEAGYGPMAANLRWTRYEEDNPYSKLDLIQWHGLYRMSFTQYVEIDAGIGQMILNHERRASGFSLTVPVRIRPHRNAGISFRPAWGWIGGNTINDIELMLSGGVRFFSVFAGYRWVSAGSATLDGPVFGLSYHM